MKLLPYVLELNPGIHELTFIKVKYRKLRGKFKKNQYKAHLTINLIMIIIIIIIVKYRKLKGKFEQ